MTTTTPRPRGRPPWKTRPRSVTVRFRCTPEAREYFRRAAEKSAETLTDYLRGIAIVESADALGDDPDEAMRRLDGDD